MTKLLTILMIFASVASRAATINASSASRADVSSAITSASNGDTVVIPAGSASWTTGIIFTKGITLQGNGISNTTITISGLPSASGGGALQASQTATHIIRITGIQFNGVEWARPAISMSGSPSDALFRIDNCRFNSSGDLTAINCWGGGRGVIDHCFFESSGAPNEMIHNMAYGTGDNTGWAYAVTPGSDDAVYVEANSFKYNATGNPAYFFGASSMQTYYGGRTVFRYNTNQMTQFDNHGTPGSRGGRWWECYSNRFVTITSANQDKYFALRAGSGVIFGNHHTGPNSATAGVIMYEEDSGGYPQQDQVGRGINQTLAPAYIWGNTDDNNGGSMAVGGDSLIVLNRDYYLSAKPGYTPYTYPHPLTIAGDAPNGDFTFTATNYNVAENAGTVTVSVSRINGSDQAVGVQYGTTNGSATTTTHYTGVTNWLTWANADTATKTFTVTIANDGSENAARYFTVRILQATNANLGTITNATVTILDDDDTTAPVLTSVSSGTPSSSFATIAWDTTEASSTIVDYGLTASFGSSVTNTSPVTSHSITVSGLSASTLYYYRAKSLDAFNNVGISTTNTFTTASAPAAGEIYVDSSVANDSGDGSSGSPYKTLTNALANMVAGSTMYVKNGTNYYLPFWIITGPDGDSDHTNTIKNFPGHSPWIIGPGDAGRVALSETAYWLWDGVNISNFNNCMVVRSNSHHVVVQNSKLWQSGNQIVHTHTRAYNLVFQNNDLRNGGALSAGNGEAFYLGTHGGGDSIHDILVRSNTISGMTSDGIEVKHDSYNITVEYNTLTNCVTFFDYGKWNIIVQPSLTLGQNPNHIIRGNVMQSVHSTGTGAAIGAHGGGYYYNNIVYGVTNPAYAVEVDLSEAGGAQATNNLVYVWNNTFNVPSARAVNTISGTASISNNIGPTTGNNREYFSTNFVAASSHNYALNAGSIYADTGTAPPFTISTDFAGAARAGTWDLGAFNYTAPLPAVVIITNFHVQQLLIP